MEQNTENQNQNSSAPKKSYWKFVAGLLGIIIIIAGGFFVWDGYLSPRAKSERQTQEDYEKYLAWEKNYKKAMADDTYGGKTPEETLQMFIEALKKEDVELASKYFVIDTQNSKEKWRSELEKIKTKGGLGEIINFISRAVPTSGQKPLGSTFWFSIYNDKKEAELLIEMSLNQQSGVWKIVNI